MPVAQTGQETRRLPVTGPFTEDIDCNFEPLVDVGAIDP